MLETLSIIPYPKVVLLQDSRQISGTRLLLSLLNNHIGSDKHGVHFLCIENHPERYKPLLGNRVNYCNLTGSRSWKKETILSSTLEALQCRSPVIVVIDSISEIILQFGLDIFKILNHGITNPNLLQLVALLHTDCTPGHLLIKERLSHMATVNLILFNAKNSQRLLYIQNKLSGKVVKNELEFGFLNNRLFTKTVAAFSNNIVEPITKSPEDLATFRIALGSEEKQSRDNVVLPYLKAKESPCNRLGGEGKVFYELDEADDWDEEDPDDDLDV